MSQVTKDILKKNRAEIERFPFMYEFKFYIKFTERSVFISAYKNHVIQIKDDTVITHADCKTNTLAIEELMLADTSDFTTMKQLVNDLIDANFNKKKMQFKIYLLSNKPKLETCKYVFVLKDFASRKLQEIRDSNP